MIIIRFIKACFKALHAFGAAKDDLGTPCRLQHPRLKAWATCPICDIKGSKLRADRALPTAAIRIRDGQSHFRTLPLYQGNYVIGHDITSDIVITPQDRYYSAEPSRYRLQLKEQSANLQLTWGQDPFVIHDSEYKKTSLYDRDRIQLLGGQCELFFLKEGGHA